MGKQTTTDTFMAEFNGVEVTFQASRCYGSKDKGIRIPIINTDDRPLGTPIPPTASFDQLHFFLGNKAEAKMAIEKSVGLKINGAKKPKKCRRPIITH